MKHATTAALAWVPALTTQIRLPPGLVEKQAGVAFRNGQAILHFHEDPGGDVR